MVGPKRVGITYDHLHEALQHLVGHVQSVGSGVAFLLEQSARLEVLSLEETDDGDYHIQVIAWIDYKSLKSFSEKAGLLNDRAVHAIPEGEEWKYFTAIMAECAHKPPHDPPQSTIDSGMEEDDEAEGYPSTH